MVGNLHPPPRFTPRRIKTRPVFFSTNHLEFEARKEPRSGATGAMGRMEEGEGGGREGGEGGGEGDRRR